MEFFNIFNLINLQAQVIEMVILLSVLILLIFIILSLSKINNETIKRIDSSRDTLREELKFSIQPNFIEMSISVESLVRLAVEVWRIEQRIVKISSSLTEVQRKGIQTSAQRLKRYLEGYDIEIRDYTGQKFNEGLNLDVLSVEKDSSIVESIVKETVEPTILCKGQVVKKAKIILLNN